MSQFSSASVGSNASTPTVAIATKSGAKIVGPGGTLIQVPNHSVGLSNHQVGGHVVVSSGSAVEMSGESIQLMSGSLPTSNLYVNYPHTMWEKDAEGNRVQIIKQEDGVNPDDILSQATASIKQEPNANGVIIRTISNAEQASELGVMPPTPQRKQPTQVGPDGQPLPRPHVCEVCQKTFVKREHLTKHLRIHKNDNKRYSCEYCQKAFRDRYELVRHTRRHTGDFPFR
eukprot:TCALIF_00492-PA protein Name:"Similar to ZNF384 Zinc finger protein 384 (Homo sapiens)" AED:0.56 eAED:0.57 QI:0/-1/0/1/-1/1/1/0/228